MFLTVIRICFDQSSRENIFSLLDHVCILIPSLSFLFIFNQYQIINESATNATYSTVEKLILFLSCIETSCNMTQSIAHYCYV